MKKTTDNRYCYHISSRNSVGKSAKKNATQVSGREHAKPRSLSDASVTSGSHVTLIVTLASFTTDSLVVTFITIVTVRFSNVNRDLVFYFFEDGLI